MNLTSILLRRNLIPTPKGLAKDNDLPAAGNEQITDQTLATVLLNFQSLGYALAPTALIRWQWSTQAECNNYYRDIIEVLKEFKGADHKFDPMYPNFPQQVMEMSDAELYINAYIHYFTVWVSDLTGAKDVIWLPQYSKKTRKPLNEVTKLTVLNPVMWEDLDRKLTEITLDLAKSNTSLSPTDKEELYWLVRHAYLQRGVDRWEVPEMPHKENAAIVLGALISGHFFRNNATISEGIQRQTKTATDVLRIATAISNGDVSLAEDSKFVSFDRPERNILLGLLDALNADSRLEDMNRWKMRWIRLGERLHPGEFKNRYPFAYEAFRKLRSGETIPTFNTAVEHHIRKGSAWTAAKQLVKRPGEFARRLDQLLRIEREGNQIEVVDLFETIADQVSTPVILQTRAHFKDENEDYRVIFPKGNTAKVQVLKGREPLSLNLRRQIENICDEVLLNRFKDLSQLGKIGYIDPVLEGYLVPFSQRSASKSLRTLIRGSKIPFGSDKGTARFFIWWKNQDKDKIGEEGLYRDGRVDIDLSAFIYAENWTAIEQIAYYNLRNIRGRTWYGVLGKSKGYHAVHSGDITNAPNGACEFIDIDIQSAIEYGARYVIMNVNSYTNQKFSELPGCCAGWMMREEPQSGEVFDPRTVMDKFDLTAPSKIAMPLILDLVKREVIWADASLVANRRRVNNIANNSDQISLIGQALSNFTKPNLHDLFWLHVAARGMMITTNKSRADAVYSIIDGLPSLNGEILTNEKIASEYLTNGDWKKKPTTEKQLTSKA